MKRETVLRLVLAIIIITNLVLGSMCYLSGSMALKVGGFLHGATLTELTPQLEYILRMMGCYLIGLGVLAAFPFVNPVKFKVITYGTAVWVILRGLQRFLFASDIHAAFGVSYARIYINGIVILAGGVLLFLMTPISKTE